MENNKNFKQQNIKEAISKENIIKSYDVEGLIAGAFVGIIVAIVGITDILMGIVVGMFIGLIVGTYIKKR